MKALSRDRNPAKSEILPRAERTAHVRDAGLDIPVQSPERETMALVGKNAGKGQTVKHAVGGAELFIPVLVTSVGALHTAFGLKDRNKNRVKFGLSVLAAGAGLILHKAAWLMIATPLGAISLGAPLLILGAAAGLYIYMKHPGSAG